MNRTDFRRIGPHAARHHDAAVFSQRLAYGFKRFALGSVDEAAGVDHHQIGLFIAVAELIAIRPKPRNDMLGVHQRLRAAKAYQADLWSLRVHLSDIVLHYRVSIPYYRAMQGSSTNHELGDTELQADMRPRELAAEDATFVLDADGQIIQANGVAKRLFAMEEESLRHRRLPDLVAEDSLPVAERALKKALREGSGCSEILVRTQPSQDMLVELSVSRFQLGGETYLQCNLHNIQHRRNNELQLRRLALHDHLTTLPNRFFLEKQLRQQVRAFRRDGHQRALVFVDLDGFKLINDSYGHFVGDRLLFAFANKLKSVRPDEGFIARVGGDEFVILLTRGADDAEISRLIAELLDLLTEGFDIFGRELFVSACFGISKLDDADTSPEEWLRRADIALYEAKALGKGASATFVPEMQRRIVQRLTVESQLRRAIDESEFELYYQPIVDLHSGRTISFEALLRWRHPSQGILTPRHFLEHAADAHLIPIIDLWVAEKASLQLAAWRAAGSFIPDSLSINLSAETLGNRNIMDRIVDFLEGRKDFMVEITEATMFGDQTKVQDSLEALRAAGVHIALDDFGTGFSSLAYLQEFQVDVLKVDKSFIAKAFPQSHILSSIVALGRMLKIPVLIEGVETSQHLGIVQTLKCQYAQGFFFSPALAADEIEEFMSDEPVWSTG